MLQRYIFHWYFVAVLIANNLNALWTWSLHWASRFRFFHHRTS